MAFFDIFKKKQDNSAAQASEERKQQQEELNAGLEKTKTGLFSKLARAVAGRSTVDADVLDDLEEVLISSVGHPQFFECLDGGFRVEHAVDGESR